VIEISFILPATLALGFDRQIARSTSWYSLEVGEFYRKRRVCGTFTTPPAPRLVYQNFLFLIRFWGTVMTSLGILVFLTC